MKLHTIFLALLITGGIMTTQAQQKSVNQHQKVEQLFAVLDMEEACMQAAKTSADETLAKVPQLASREAETRAFFTKYMNYAASKDDMIKLYEKYYTPEEIDDLIKFYKTSAGKKQTSIAPKLQAEATALTTQNLQMHASELNQLLAPSATSNSDSSHK